LHTAQLVEEIERSGLKGAGCEGGLFEEALACSATFRGKISILASDFNN